MKLLSVLITVFMVSNSAAQDYDANDVHFAQQKKPAGTQASVNVTCNQGYEGYGNVRGATSWLCKDPKTGRTERVKCKNPPKQEMPPKMTMAKLKKACGLLDGLEDIDSNGG